MALSCFYLFTENIRSPLVDICYLLDSLEKDHEMSYMYSFNYKLHEKGI